MAGEFAHYRNAESSLTGYSADAYLLAYGVLKKKCSDFMPPGEMDKRALGMATENTPWRPVAGLRAAVINLIESPINKRLVALGGYTAAMVFALEALDRVARQNDRR